jgi:hypothetical protein
MTLFIKATEFVSTNMTTGKWYEVYGRTASGDYLIDPNRPTTPGQHTYHPFWCITKSKSITELNVDVVPDGWDVP